METIEQVEAGEISKMVYTFKNDFEDYLEARDKGIICRIDEEMFDYWLEVLPPVYMNQKQTIKIFGVPFEKLCLFGFAEGREFIVDFWSNGEDSTGRNPYGVYFCKKSNRLNRWGAS